MTSYLLLFNKYFFEPNHNFLVYFVYIHNQLKTRTVSNKRYQLHFSSKENFINKPTCIKKPFSNNKTELIIKFI